jgi:hypothetical protein
VVAGHTQLVAVRVAKVRAVVVGVVLRAQPRRAFAGATAGQGQGVNGIHLPARRRQKSHRLAIARLVRLLIVWAANEKVG